MKTLFLALLLAAPMTANASSDVQINILPEIGYLLPGSAANCLDISAYKIALSKSIKRILITSVAPLRMSFPKFSLTWTVTSKLSIQLIRISIESTSVKDGSYSYDIIGDELQALIGAETTNQQKNGYMSSNDPARDCNPKTQTNVMTGFACESKAEVFSSIYGACGLDVGGIELAGSKEKAFTAPVKIELFGIITDRSGSFKPIYSEALTQIKFDGIN